MIIPTHELFTPKERRAAKQFYDFLQRRKLQKPEEILAKFEEQVRAKQLAQDTEAGAEQIARNFKLYHGIK